MLFRSEEVLSGYFEGAITVIPDYPNDTAAAMDLWKKLLKLGYTVELFSHRQNAYSCVVGRIDDDGCHHCLPDVDADTDSRAITRAFVLIMEEE